VLGKWYAKRIDNPKFTLNPRSEKKADEILNLFTAAVIDGKVDAVVGEEPANEDGETTLKAFIKEYTNRHVDRKGEEHTSTSIRPMLGVISNGRLGKWTLDALVDDKTGAIEKWLDETGGRRKWKASTWNDYHALLYTIFEKAVDWDRARRNPIRKIETRTEYRPEHFKQRVLVEDVQAKLIEACDELDAFDRARFNTKQTLTQAQVDDIRARAEKGELQKDIATRFKVSATTVCQIVNGRTWNPKLKREPTRGKVMKRRLMAAFRSGSRAGEMLKSQIKHVEWVVLRIDGVPGYRFKLPPAITKGGKTSGKNEYLYAMGEDFVKMLDERRLQFRRRNTTTGKMEPDPDGFIFGTEAGHYQTRFTKTAKRLFGFAGLDWGRDRGIVWHLIRHEFISRVWEETKDQDVTQEMARHKDFKTTKLYMAQREDAMLKAAAGMAKNKRA